MMQYMRIGWLLLLAALLAACGGRDERAAAATAVSSTPSAPLPWQTMSLTDVRTGDTFTLADFSGKTVIIETMAVWCPLCQQQQAQVKRALDNLDPEQVVAVALNVDPRETAEKLQAFAEEEGYTWYYALSPPQMSVVLEQTFGPQILSPTSTPVIILYPDGSYELTDYGIKKWDELVELVEGVE